MPRSQVFRFVVLFAALVPLTAASAATGSKNALWDTASSIDRLGRDARTGRDPRKGDDLGDVPGTLLTSGDTVTFALPEVSQQTLFLKGYRIEVPAGGHDRLEIDVEMLTPGADLALFVRFGQDVEVVGGVPTFDYLVDTPGVGSEQLVITPSSSPALQPGTYFIGLGLVTTGTGITARITATVSGGPPVDPVGVRLTNSARQAFSFPDVQRPTVVAGFLGYRIDVPEGASRLKVDAQVNDPQADFQILVQHGFDVQLLPDGALIADQVSPGFGPSQTVSVTLDTVPAVMRGTYWIGFGLQSIETEFNGTVVASFDLGAQTPATIEVSKAGLDFISETGTDPPSEQFTIRNVGDGALDYLISADEAWVGLSTTSGTSNGEVHPVNVSVETAGLDAGAHLATITVTRGDGSEPVLIRVRLVLSGAGPPSIDVPFTELEINVPDGAGSAVRGFNLRNGGGGVLNYDISANVPWLVVSPAEGTSNGELDAILLVANPAGLGIGTFLGQVDIRDDGAGLLTTITVTLNIFANPPQPSITVSLLSFEAFASGPLPGPQAFSLANGGGGVLNYVITASQPWVTVDPASGMVETTPVAIEVTVDPTGLAAGTHEAEITIIEAAKGEQQPIVILVTLVLIGDFTPFIRKDGVVNGVE